MPALAIEDTNQFGQILGGARAATAASKLTDHQPLWRERVPLHPGAHRIEKSVQPRGIHFELPAAILDTQAARKS